MGWVEGAVPKITGQDKQMDQAERAAQAQADATRKAAEDAARQTREVAAQAGKQQSDLAARDAAAGLAQEMTSKPMQDVSVTLDKAQAGGDSGLGMAKKRRQTFGVGSSGGVNI